jgi:hypothetical protein
MADAVRRKILPIRERPLLAQSRHSAERPSRLSADIIAKVGNRTTPKISQKVFRFSSIRRDMPPTTD